MHGRRAHAALLPGDARRQDGLRQELLQAVLQHGLPLCQDAGGAVRGAPLRGAEPARRGSERRRAGLRVRAALRGHLPPRLRGGRRHPRHQGDQVLAHLQPRLLRRLQLLRAGLPPGAAPAGAQPRVARARGQGTHAAARLQGLHPRRGRPHGELPGAGLHPAAQARRVPHQAVPLPQTVPQPAPRPQRLHRPAARAARASRREEGLRALGHPLRLHHGRPARRGVHPRAERPPRVGPAARGARARLRQRARPHGKAKPGRLPAVL